MIAKSFDTIDWSATGNMLSGIGSICAAIAVLWAANKAADTYTSWRKQKIAERKIDHAERILIATYKVQYALAYVRGRFLTANELSQAEKILKEVEGLTSPAADRSKRLISAQVYIERMNHCRNDQQLLIEALPVARALWGKTLEAALITLNRQFWLIKCYAEESIYLHENADRDRHVKVNQALGASSDDTQDEISKNRHISLSDM